jgi:hypothetical protein
MQLNSMKYIEKKFREVDGTESMTTAGGIPEAGRAAIEQDSGVNFGSC